MTGEKWQVVLSICNALLLAKNRVSIFVGKIGLFIPIVLHTCSELLFG